MDYLTHWGHLYVVHFGFWMTFAFGATIYNDGIPDFKKLPALLKSAVIIAALMSVFSSHSHHYMTSIIPDTKSSMRIKVSDGDLVVLKLGGETTHAQQAAVREIFEKWTVARGLQGVQVITVKCEGESGFNIMVMSVNDIFEEHVLDGKAPTEG